ncbi:MAG: 2-C-methyl-D-erythritol 4-phosphate cytidylyltransferase [Blastocatellia bacterium AA13]|nr:MAG: 2-C-methyl-D-erythritol 4-phosphate cytidylyltransferase [Blastocatellia bacterium AA13]
MTDRLNIAIIAAAGSGTRMQADRAKQMIELGGKPLLLHTLKRFEKCDSVHEIVLVLQPDLTSEALAAISRHGLLKIKRVVAGGAERQDSIYRGLQVINANSAGIVVVHDAARPFVRPEEITTVIDRAESTGAALMALPAVDTIKQIKTARVQRTLDRSRIYHAQTPQAFRFSIIREAYERARVDGYSATDDSQLVERIGQRVSIVEGSPLNIKITRPFDLKIAELINTEYFNGAR